MRKFIVLSLILLLILSTTTLIIVITLFVDREEKGPEPVASVSDQCLAGAPDWVIAGGAEGSLSAVGIARISEAGINFARTVAIANARKEMARSISITVNNTVQESTQSTGISDDETADTAIVSQTLTDTALKAMWASPCNELFVLVVSDPAVN